MAKQIGIHSNDSVANFRFISNTAQRIIAFSPFLFCIENEVRRFPNIVYPGCHIEKMRNIGLYAGKLGIWFRSQEQWVCPNARTETNARHSAHGIPSYLSSVKDL